MPSNNGVCVSFICQDQPEAIAVVMGCGSHMHGVSCCAVFASGVAVVFLRGSSDGVTYSWTLGGVLPTECRSAALARDEVASTINKCVCVCVAPVKICSSSFCCEATSIVRTPYLEDPEGSQLLLRTFSNT